MFTLNEPYLTWYIENVLRADNRPGGSAAGLPFLWPVTVPIGVAMLAAAVPLLHWGQRRT